MNSKFKKAQNLKIYSSDDEDRGSHQIQYQQKRTINIDDDDDEQEVISPFSEDNNQTIQDKESNSDDDQSIRKSKSKKKKQQSIVWQFFQRKDGLDTCQECSKRYKVQSSTTNLLQHAKTHHDKFKKLQEKQKDHDKVENNKNEEKIESFFTKKITANVQNQFNTLIAKLIAYDMRPYCMVDSDNFKNIFKFLHPGIQIPNSQLLTQNLVPKIYDEMKYKIIKIIQENKEYGFSFTADIWTSKGNKNYLSLTCHFLNEQFQMKTFLLSTKQLIGKNTGLNIAQNLLDVMIEFEILSEKHKILLQQTSEILQEEQKDDIEDDDNEEDRSQNSDEIQFTNDLSNQQFDMIPEISNLNMNNPDINEEGKSLEQIKKLLNEQYLFITTDQASNNVSAFKNYIYIDHFHCVAHIIHNLLQSLTKLENKELHTIINTVRKISKYFRKSPQRSQKLYDIQKSLNKNEILKLKIDCATRWNSLFQMIQRFYKVKRSIQQYFLEQESQSNILQYFNYDKLRELVNFLQPFEEITHQLSEREDSSISEILKLIFTIKNTHLKQIQNDSKFIKDLKVHLSQKFQEQIKKSIFSREERKLYYITSYLNPKTKDLQFLDEEQRLEAMEYIKETYFKLQKKNNEQKEQISTTKAQIQEQPKEIIDAFGFVYYKENHQIKDDHTQKEDYDELSHYQKFQTNLIFYKNFNLHQWWNEKKEIFPILSQLSRIYLKIQSSSVESERVFSKAGNIITIKRSTLKSQHFNQLLFLSSNKKQC